MHPRSVVFSRRFWRRRVDGCSTPVRFGCSGLTVLLPHFLPNIGATRGEAGLTHHHANNARGHSSLEVRLERRSGFSCSVNGP